MKISEQTQIEANIGFLIGILLGAISSWVFIVFTTDWEWYFKVLATIGSLGIIGSLSMALYNSFNARTNYLEAKKDLDKLNNNPGGF